MNGWLSKVVKFVNHQLDHGFWSWTLLLLFGSASSWSENFVAQLPSLTRICTRESCFGWCPRNRHDVSKVLWTEQKKQIQLHTPHEDMFAAQTELSLCSLMLMPCLELLYITELQTIHEATLWFLKVYCVFIIYIHDIFYIYTIYIYVCVHVVYLPLSSITTIPTNGGLRLCNWQFQY